MSKLKIIGVLAKLYLNRDHIKKNWKTTLFGCITGLAAIFATVDFTQPVKWEEAADNMLKSLWAKQTPNRALRVTELLRGE